MALGITRVSTMPAANMERSAMLISQWLGEAT